MRIAVAAALRYCRLTPLVQRLQSAQPQRLLRPDAGVIGGVSVLQAKIGTAFAALDRHHLLDLAPLRGTLVGEHLPTALPAVVVYVQPHGHVGQIAAFYRYRNVAQRAHRHLHVLLVRAGAVMTCISYMIRAKDCLAGVALER